MAITPLILGETHVPLQITWQDDSSTAFDLTGSTITARYAPTAGGAGTAGTGTITARSDALGKFTYNYSSADVGTAGSFNWQFKAVFGDATVLLSDPITIVVNPAV